MCEEREECVEHTREKEGGGASAGMTESWLCPVKCFPPATPRILGKNIKSHKVLGRHGIPMESSADILCI